MKQQYILVLAIIIIFSSCSTNLPGSMKEFYYSVPFSDKYNQPLDRDLKDRLFKAGEWVANEDSGVARLKVDLPDQQYSEEINIRVWDGGNIAAITTFYDDGSDCPPVNELEIFRFNNNKWNKIELQGIEINDYWSQPLTMLNETWGNSNKIVFEPFLDQSINGVKFEWRTYKCSGGSLEDVPDYFEMETDKALRVASNGRDYNEIYLIWNSDYTAMEKEKPVSIRDKSQDIHEDLTIKPGIGLLLGVKEKEDIKTYFVTFSGNNISVQTLSGAIVSPQADDFYLVQTIKASQSISCEYKEGDERNETECASSASKILITKANAATYSKDLVDKKAEVSRLSKARCGSNESIFEEILFCSRNFIQYTMGGADSECAPDGPGGGFEKDTIVSFNGVKISNRAKDYLIDSELAAAHSKLFKEGLQSGIPKENIIGFCEPSEILIGIIHHQGRQKLIVKNTTGRNLQDDWERTAEIENPPSPFSSRQNDLSEALREIVDGAEDFFLSPNGQYVAHLKKENNSKVLYFNNSNNPIGIAKISLSDAQIVMEEWCDPIYWSKWKNAVDGASKFIEIPSGN